MKSIRLRSLKATEAIASSLIAAAGPVRVFAFYGHMGAGKTTLIASLCKALGVVERSSSPSYALVNEYLAANDEPVYHFDFYRINSVEEAYDMGFDQYLDSGHYCFIEWPERVDSLLPEQRIEVHLEAENEDRLLHWREIGSPQ